MEMPIYYVVTQHSVVKACYLIKEGYIECVIYKEYVKDESDFVGFYSIQEYVIRCDEDDVFKNRDFAENELRNRKIITIELNIKSAVDSLSDFTIELRKLKEEN